MLERGEQTVVVALVQADGRFVEHVHHAGEAGADLRGEPDALRFAAGKRVGRPVERQIVEPDVVEETDAGDDLLHDLVGDLRTVAVEGQRFEKGEHLFQRQRADRVDGLAADHDVPRFFAQAGAVAARAGVVLVFGELFTHGHRVGLVIAALHVGEHAFERIAPGGEAAARRKHLELDGFLARAIENHALDALR